MALADGQAKEPQSLTKTNLMLAPPTALQLPSNAFGVNARFPGKVETHVRAGQGKHWQGN